MPRVRGNVTLSGHKVSLGCHVPIQTYYYALNNARAQRFAILGATETHVVVCWSANTLGWTAIRGDFLPQVVIPITVEVFDELNG